MPMRCLLFDKIERIRKVKVLELHVIGLLKPSEIRFLGGTSESMVASENRSVKSEKGAGGLEFGVFARSSGSR